MTQIDPHHPAPDVAPGSRRPFHVAVIMDGNGRWAAARGLPRTAGHVRGVDSARAVLQAAPDLGITHLTLFAFSTENWRRPAAEVSVLLNLMRRYLREEVSRLVENGVHLGFIGDRSRLPADLRAMMADAEEASAANDRLHLTIAVSYGGRNDIVQAARRLAEQARSGALDPACVDEAALSGALDTAGLPDPDLLIRTGGETRISNFLLWQCAYAELVFRDTYWPDFDRAELEACVAQYAGRERRFGMVFA